MNNDIGPAHVGGAKTQPATVQGPEDQKRQTVVSCDDSVIEDVITRLESQDFGVTIRDRSFRERSSSSMSEVELDSADQDDVISDLLAETYAAAGRLRRWVKNIHEKGLNLK